MTCNKKNIDGISDICIRTNYQNNKSSKMLQAEMIRNRKNIIYNNTRTANIYNTIINGTYEDNIKLSQSICVDTYRIYWRQLILSRISTTIKTKINEYYYIAYPPTE